MSHVVACDTDVSRPRRGITVGVLFHHDENVGGIFVERIAPGVPSDRTGCVRQGDFLVTIDDKDVHGQDLEYISKCSQVPEGSEVRLGFYNSDVVYTDVVINFFFADPSCPVTIK